MLKLVEEGLKERERELVAVVLHHHFSSSSLPLLLLPSGERARERVQSRLSILVYVPVPLALGYEAKDRWMEGESSLEVAASFLLPSFPARRPRLSLSLPINKSDPKRLQGVTLLT